MASAQGNSAAAGAAGAAVGEMSGILASNIYQKSPDKLSEEQKQTISALATLASGLSGAIIGNGAGDTVASAQAGKTTVENNYLSSTQAVAFDKKLSDCRKFGGNCQAVIDKWKAVSDKQSTETDQKLRDNPLEAQV